MCAGTSAVAECAPLAFCEGKGPCAKQAARWAMDGSNLTFTLRLFSFLFGRPPAGVQKLQPLSKIWANASFIDEVLLAHSYTYSLT